MQIVSHTSMALIDNEFYHASELGGRSSDSICVSTLVYGDPPTNNVKHEWYFVGNISPGWKWGKHYTPQFSGGQAIRQPTIDETPDRALPLPGWFYESNDRGEAMAFVNGFRWY